MMVITCSTYVAFVFSLARVHITFASYTCVCSCKRVRVLCVSFSRRRRRRRFIHAKNSRSIWHTTPSFTWLTLCQTRTQSAARCRGAFVHVYLLHSECVHQCCVLCHLVPQLCGWIAIISGCFFVCVVPIFSGGQVAPKNLNATTDNRRREASAAQRECNVDALCTDAKRGEPDRSIRTFSQFWCNIQHLVIIVLRSYARAET